MPTYHKKTYGLRVCGPKHHLDNKTWKAWPENPDVVVERNGILFKWTCETVQSSNDSDYPFIEQDLLEVTKLFSLDYGKTWQEDEFTASYRWEGSAPKTPMEDKLDSAFQFEKTKEQKQNQRELAQKRRLKLKEEAEAEGITMTELQQRRKVKRERENPHKVSKKDVEQLQRKIAVGSILKELQDELVRVMEKLGTEHIKITHPTRYTAYLEEAIQVLKRWQQ